MSDIGSDQGTLRCQLSWLLGDMRGSLPRGFEVSQELVLGLAPGPALASWLRMKFPESLGADRAPALRAAIGPRRESLGAPAPCLLLKPGMQPRHLVSCLGFPGWLVAPDAFSLSLIFLFPPHLCWPSLPFSE